MPLPVPYFPDLQIRRGWQASAVEPPHAAGGSGLVYPHEVDFTPAAGAAVVDAGVRIPGVNDDRAGRAPDISAIEVGQAKISGFHDHLL